MPIPQVPSQLAVILATGTYDANWFSGSTIEQRIQNAINAAFADGAPRVLVHETYDPSLITFNNSVKMIREGGNPEFYDVVAYGGKQADGNISTALRRAVVAAQANGGGTVDLMDILSTWATIATDFGADIPLYDKTPIQFLWGNWEVRIKTRSRPRSHHHHTFSGTRFVMKDENGARVTGSVFPFYTNSVETTPAGGVISTSGSNIVTKSTPSDLNWGMLEVGSPLLINGFVPPIGVDTTTINVGGGINSSTTTITVVSTTAFATASELGWPSGGKIRIENEIIGYTSKSATQFLGCVRGSNGTTAAAHADTTRVDRVSYQPVVVTGISGNAITLDTPMNVNANNLETQIGIFDLSFDGVGDFDGNKDPAVDDTNNPQGLWINGARKVFIGPSVSFHDWDHGGWTLTACQDSVAYGRGGDNGALSIGVGFWVFGWNKRLTVDILEVWGCITGLAVDDRSIIPTIIDGPSEYCNFHVRHATRMGGSSVGNGLLMDGCRRCFGVIDVAEFVAGLGGCQGIAFGGASQWGDETTTPAVDNIMEVGYGSSPDGTYLAVNANSGGNAINTFIVKQRATALNVQPKNTLLTLPTIIGLTYGTTVNISAARTETWTLNVTNGVGFTIANPTVPTDGRLLSLWIANTSGGAMGAITWGGAFRLAGAFVNPATANARSITFRYNHPNSTWIEISRTAADQLV